MKSTTPKETTKPPKTERDRIVSKFERLIKSLEKLQKIEARLQAESPNPKVWGEK